MPEPAVEPAAEQPADAAGPVADPPRQDASLTPNDNRNLMFVENVGAGDGTDKDDRTAEAKRQDAKVDDTVVAPAKLDIKPDGEAVTLITKRRFDKRLLLAGVAGLVVLAAGGLTVWQALENRRNNSPEAQQERARAFEEVTDQARQQNDLWRYDEEVSTLEEYLATKPEDKHYKPAAMSLAKAYVNNKQYDKAIGLYKELEKDPKYQLDAWRGLGAAYVGKEDRAQARKYYQQVVAAMRTKTDPESIFQLTTDEAMLNSVEG